MFFVNRAPDFYRSNAHPVTQPTVAEPGYNNSINNWQTWLKNIKKLSYHRRTARRRTVSVLKSC